MIFDATYTHLILSINQLYDSLQVISSNQLKRMYSNSCLLLRIHLNRFGAPQGEELPDVPLAKELPDVPLAEELV